MTNLKVMMQMMVMKMIKVRNLAVRVPSSKTRKSTPLELYSTAENKSRAKKKQKKKPQKTEQIV